MGSSAVTGFTRLWSSGRYCNDRDTEPRGLYVLFRLNEVEDVRNIEDSAKIAWQDLLGLGQAAEFNRGGSKFDPNTSACVSHSGCNISTSCVTESAGLSITSKDVIQMAKSILTTEQPGEKEIALLVPYWWVAQNTTILACP